jgi:hypothetical protein
VLGDFRIDDLTAERLQALERPFLVGPHQARVARHVGGEDRGKPAIDAFGSQSGVPQPHGPKRLSALGAHVIVKEVNCHSISQASPLRLSVRAALARMPLVATPAEAWPVCKRAILDRSGPHAL